MHKALHPWDNGDRLYVSKKEEGRRLASIEDSIDASIPQHEDYIEKHEGGLSHEKRHWQHDGQQNGNKYETKMGKKKLYERFKQLINNIFHDKTWTWLRKGNF